MTCVVLPSWYPYKIVIENYNTIRTKSTNSDILVGITVLCTYSQKWIKPWMSHLSVHAVVQHNILHSNPGVPLQPLLTNSHIQKIAVEPMCPCESSTQPSWPLPWATKWCCFLELSILHHLKHSPSSITRSYLSDTCYSLGNCSWVNSTTESQQSKQSCQELHIHV